MSLNRRRTLPFALATFTSLSFAACVGDSPGGEPSSGGGGSVDGGSSSSSGAPGASSSSSSSGGSEPDAAEAAAPSCAPLAPFTTFELVGTINEPRVIARGGRLGPDQLTIYFSKHDPVPFPNGPIDRMYYATRVSTAVPFGAPVALFPNAAADGLEDNAEYGWVDATQTTLFYNTTGGAPGSANVKIATRGNAAANFLTGDHVAAIGSINESREPWVSADASRLYYSSSQGLSVAAKVGTTYGEITPLNVSGSNPVLSADELTLWFTSFDESVGKVFVTQRTSLDTAFGTPVAAAGLTRPGTTRPSWLSVDGCTMYLTSEEAMSSGLPPTIEPETHVFRATRVAQ